MKYTNEEKAIEKLKSGTHFSSSVFENFRDNEKVVEVALQQPKINYAFQYVSDRLRDNENLARLAVRDKTNFPKVSERLKDDKEFVLHAMKNGCALVYSSNRLSEDKEIITEYVKQSGLNIKDIHEKYIDKDVVMASVKEDGIGLLHCPAKYREDKEIVLEAIKSKPYALKYASAEIKELCKDKDSIKTLETAILHEQLEKVVPPKTMDFAKALSAECKQATMEQSKPKARMKI